MDRCGDIAVVFRCADDLATLEHAGRLAAARNARLHVLVPTPSLWLVHLLHAQMPITNAMLVCVEAGPRGADVARIAVAQLPQNVLVRTTVRSGAPWRVARWYLGRQHIDLLVLPSGAGPGLRLLARRLRARDRPPSVLFQQPSELTVDEPVDSVRRAQRRVGADCSTVSE